jgi:uncharacterized protein (TIGR01244 family)
MEIRQVTEDYAVAGQVTAEDVPAIAAAGFRTLICNRPDAEQPGQPQAGEIEAAAKANGLEYRFIPVISGHLTPENVTDMARALQEAPGPVLAYCRSGARSANLYILAKQAGG